LSTLHIKTKHFSGVTNSDKTSEKIHKKTRKN
ncbi:MAG: hypothetical protein ACI9U0_002370, partial [Flavobacteriales bacterium]